MARGGLGRDFFEILDDNIYEAKRDSITSLSINDVEPRKDQPRKNFNDESLKVLADSIAVHGVLQPIIVRENSDFAGRYEIIAGERRWRAARMVPLSEIPVVIVDADDMKTAQIALVENVQREDLNPVEEAYAYKALIERHNFTQEQVGKEVGKSRSTITNMLRLIELPDEVLELLKDGKLTIGHARALLPIADEDKMILLAQRICEEDLSVRRVEEIVKKLLAENDEEILAVKTDDSVQRRIYMRELEKRVMDKLGRRVKINQTTKKKTVELTFDTDSDLEELLCLICGNDFFAM